MFDFLFLLLSSSLMYISLFLSFSFLFLSFLMLFFVFSFSHFLFLSFLMLFFVFIILSLSLSVFPYVILCFDHSITFSFCLSLCYSLFLPSITLSICLSLCYFLFLPSITFSILFSVFRILSLSLFVFPYVILCFFLLSSSLMLFFVFFYFFFVFTFWFTLLCSKITSFWRRGTSFLTNLKSLMNGFANLAWWRQTTRRMRKSPKWHHISDIDYVDMTNEKTLVSARRDKAEGILQRLSSCSQRLAELEPVLTHFLDRSRLDRSNYVVNRQAVQVSDLLDRSRRSPRNTVVFWTGSLPRSPKTEQCQELISNRKRVFCGK